MNERRDRIISKLENRGGLNIKVEEGYTMNDPSDPEGHRLPPIKYPAEIKADGIDEATIAEILTEIDAEDAQAAQAAEEQESSRFAARLLKALVRPEIVAELKRQGGRP